MVTCIDIDEKIDEIKAEVLNSIKEKFSDILGKDSFRPLVLDNVSIIDNSSGVFGSPSSLSIHNIFIDEKGRLCADFLNKDSGFNTDFIFGRCIEDIFLEDLVKILNKLNNYKSSGENKRFLTGNENFNFELPIKKSFIKSLLNSKNA